MLASECQFLYGSSIAVKSRKLKNVGQKCLPYASLNSMCTQFRIQMIKLLYRSLICFHLTLLVVMSQLLLFVFTKRWHWKHVWYLRCSSKHNVRVSIALMTPLWPSNTHLSTRGPLAYGYCHCLRPCVCVCLSVCQLLLVRAITHHPIKLGSPNLDQKMQNILLQVRIVLGAD